MTKYKTYEIELSPVLLKKLFEFVKSPAITADDFHWITKNLIELSYCDDTLTMDEYEIIVTKPVTM